MAEPPHGPGKPAKRAGLSLKALTDAFAQAMGLRATRRADEQDQCGGGDGKNADTSDSPAAAAAPSAEDPQAPLSPADAEIDGQVSPRSILEAMLFVGNRDNAPLEAARAAEVMRGIEQGDIPKLVDELNTRYLSSGCPYEVISEGGGYRLVLRKGFHALRGHFYGRIREARLSQAAVETLAIVAYRQPLSADDVTKLRGTPTAHILAQLVRRQLIAIERVPNDRKAVYRTTSRFLDLFGLDSLADLPQSEEP